MSASRERLPPACGQPNSPEHRCAARTAHNPCFSLVALRVVRGCFSRYRTGLAQSFNVGEHELFPFAGQTSHVIPYVFLERSIVYSRRADRFSAKATR
jgi:hypothetical protein